ncbi:putative maltase-glucoamylase 2 isoform X1 [Tamandua tetradactyla]|uniref:putative maltase-glucoamylase 2 isoform X1 n=1 Tax=Tamandua tetradactyla TaxID=48850 RepID=UPI004053EE66
MRNLNVLEVLLIILFLIVLAVDIFLLLLVLENTSDSFVPECSAGPQSERIDCSLGQLVTEKNCRRQRGCCWNPVADTNVPKCFFPRNWGYKVSGDRQNTSNGEHCPLLLSR